MTKHRILRATEVDVRRFRVLLDSVGDNGSAGVLVKTEAGFENAVIVAGPMEFPSEDPDGVVNNRPLRNLNGNEWSDTVQGVPIRRISNGNQIATPVGTNGLCVQDSAFWAINIGDLDPATHPLTGHSEGVAGVLKVKDDGDLEITDDRLPYVRRDEADTILDGTLIQLGYVSGTLTLIWAACEPHVDLAGLDPTP